MNNMSVKELKEMAKELKVKNWWNLKKADLISAIEAAKAEDTEELVADSVQNEDYTVAVENSNGDMTVIAEVHCEDISKNVQNESESAEDSVSDEVIEETEETTQKEPENAWATVAMKQLNNAYRWIVGGNENSVNEGNMTNKEFNKWIAEKALKEVYHEAFTTMYNEDYVGGNAPSEMKFADKDLCIKYLIKLFMKDGYEVEEKPKKKGKDMIEYDGRIQNLSQWAKELNMPGQTLFARIHISGWSVEKTFTTPVKKRKNKAEV